MSQLIDIDPQIQSESEPEGYEFGYYTFDSLPALEVSNAKTPQDTSLNIKDNDTPNNDLWQLPIDNDTLSNLQHKDIFCKNILDQIEKGNIIEGPLYIVKDKILKRYVIDGDNTYETIVVLRAITIQILEWLTMKWDTMEPTEPILCLRDITIGKG